MALAKHGNVFVHKDNSNKPLPTKNAKPIDAAEQREILRLLRFFRDDVRRKYPLLNAPNSWQIKCLVYSCEHTTYRSRFWLRDISHVLSILANQTKRELRGSLQFYQTDGQTPLFPCDDGFNLTHLLHFIDAIQKHIASIENNLL